MKSGKKIYICQILSSLIIVLSVSERAGAAWLTDCLQVLLANEISEEAFSESGDFPWLEGTKEELKIRTDNEGYFGNESRLKFVLLPKVVSLIKSDYSSDPDLIAKTSWRWMGSRLMGHQWDQNDFSDNPFLEEFLTLAPLMSSGQRKMLGDLIGDRPMPPKLDFIRTEENGWNPFPLEKSLLELLIRVAAYEEKAWKKLLDLYSTARTDIVKYSFNLHFKPLIDNMPDNLRENLLQYAGKKYWNAKQMEPILAQEIEDLSQKIKTELEQRRHPNELYLKISKKKAEKDGYKDSRRLLDAFINVAFRGDLFMLDLIENGLHPLEAYKRYHERVGAYFPIPSSQRVPYYRVPPMLREVRNLIVATFGEDAFHPNETRPLFLRGSVSRRKSMGLFVGGSVINGRGSLGSDVDMFSPNEISLRMLDGLHEVIERTVPEAGDKTHRSHIGALEEILVIVSPVMFQLRGGVGSSGEGSVVMRIYKAFDRNTPTLSTFRKYYSALPIGKQTSVEFDISDAL